MSSLLISWLMRLITPSIRSILSKMMTYMGTAFASIGLAIKYYYQIADNGYKQKAFKYYITISKVQMSQSTETFKYTIIQSPINQLATDSILQRWSNVSQQFTIQHPGTMNNIRRRLEMESKSQQKKKGIYQREGNFLQPKINTIRFEEPHQTCQQQVEESIRRPNLLNNQTMIDSSGSSINNPNFQIFSNCHSKEKVESPSTQNALKPSKNQTFNRILQQLGEFKKSIHQIREKLEKNASDTKYQKKNISQKKQQKLHSYDYSHQNYNYTNYRDLSNRGKPKHSYDRWKSQGRSYTFLNDQIAVQQFIIDASDSK